jgi:hypothetical protein
LSPPLNIVTIDGDGREDDPNCLHCHLAKAITAWAEAHPLKGLSEMVLEVGEALGELVASDSVECDAKEFSHRLAELMNHVDECAREMRDAIAEKLAKDAARANERGRAH